MRWQDRSWFATIDDVDFSWTPDQLAYRDSVVAFAKSELSSDVSARDAASEFGLEDWKACAAFGLQSLSIPKEYNASGVDTELMTAVLAMEAMGYGCPDNGLTFALNTQMWTVQFPIYKFGTEHQKQKYLPSMCAGERIGAHCLTEPDSGSDAFALQMTASPCPGGYRLNGTKSYITLGPLADITLIFATCDPEKGKWGVTAFLVDADTDGFASSPARDKMGLRTAPMSDIVLTDCFVPEENRLGPEGAGVSISNSCLELERCCILASQLGAMERQLEASIRHAKSRRQFDQPIGKFQSVSNRVADMKLRLETARLLLYQVAWSRQNGRPAMLEAALLKLHLSESFVASSLDAIRTHGGAGYMSDAGVERDLRDAVGGLLYAGTSDIQRVIIARLLGL